MNERRGTEKKVVGVGLACLDQLVLWRDVQAPVADNRILDFQVQGGGMVGTALVTVARLGGKAEFWGAVGDDWMGQMILDGLRCEGVDTRYAAVVPGGRGPTVVVCVDRPTGERRFLYVARLPQSVEPLGSLASLRGAGCLLVDGTHPNSALRAAREARRLGVPVVADLSYIDEHAASLLAHVTYAIISDGCARQIADGGDHLAACRSVRGMGPQHVVITLGGRGLVYLDGDRPATMPAFDVKVIDTTGAGDVFHGALCYAVVKGIPFAECLHLASAVAAMKCRQLGGRAGIPGWDEVVRFLVQRGVDWPEGR